MVALCIVAIVLVAVYQLHLSTLTASQAARFDIVASMLAQKKLSDLEIRPENRDETGPFFGEFGNDFPGYKWEMTLERVDSAALKGSGHDLRKIELRIIADGQPSTYRIRTYRMIQ